jgi:hypothetical protein
MKRKNEKIYAGEHFDVWCSENPGVLLFQIVERDKNQKG